MDIVVDAIVHLTALHQHSCVVPTRSLPVRIVNKLTSFAILVVHTIVQSNAAGCCSTTNLHKF